MNVILASAKLVLCTPCRAHAHIVFADGEKTSEFFSPEEGTIQVSSLASQGAITKYEAELLRKSLRDWEELLRKNERLYFLVIQAFLETSA